VVAKSCFRVLVAGPAELFSKKHAAHFFGREKGRRPLLVAVFRIRPAPPAAPALTTKMSAGAAQPRLTTSPPASFTRPRLRACRQQ